MTWMIYLLTALLFSKKAGAAIALVIAASIDGLSEVVYMVLGDAQPMYVYYVALFLLMFVWWMITSELKMLSSQIIAGIACSFSSLLVIDCYLAGGYETALSVVDPYVFMAINIVTLWAAYNDRGWSYATHCSNGDKNRATNDKATERC